MAATTGAARDAFIGLGSNLGDRGAELERAFEQIGTLPATALVARSSIYESAPLDAPGGDYLNAVALVRTALAPQVLLAALQAIEHAHGRVRAGPNAPRTLDLDLLLYDAERIDTPGLVVPHPRLHERAFVLVPLAEIAPTLVIPGCGPVHDLALHVASQRLAKLGR
jgi:2-amino-4-hydroxy-6-hydroxymethyldihydropteridine diphosphokinase